MIITSFIVPAAALNMQTDCLSVLVKCPEIYPCVSNLELNAFTKRLCGSQSSTSIPKVVVHAEVDRRHQEPHQRAEVQFTCPSFEGIT